MLKKSITIIVVYLFSWTLSTVTIQADSVSESNEQQSSNINSEIETYNDNVKDLKKISFKELKDIYDSGVATYIYIGRPSCPHCRALSPAIKQVNILKGYKIYYYNTDGNDFNDEARNLIYNIIGIPGVPSVFCLKNQQIVSGWVGDGIDASGLNEHLFGADESSTSNTSETSSVAATSNTSETSSVAATSNTSEVSSVSKEKSTKLPHTSAYKNNNVESMFLLALIPIMYLMFGKYIRRTKH